MKPGFWIQKPNNSMQICWKSEGLPMLSYNIQSKMRGCQRFRRTQSAHILAEVCQGFWVRMRQPRHQTSTISSARVLGSAHNLMIRRKPQWCSTSSSLHWLSLLPPTFKLPRLVLEPILIMSMFHLGQLAIQTKSERPITQDETWLTLQGKKLLSNLRWLNDQTFGKAWLMTWWAQSHWRWNPRRTRKSRMVLTRIYFDRRAIFRRLLQ